MPIRETNLINFEREHQNNSEVNLPEDSCTKGTGRASIEINLVALKRLFKRISFNILECII